MNETDSLKYEVQNFIAAVRNVQSRQEFMNRVQEFDTRFIQEQNRNADVIERPKSVEKLQPVVQQKPRNPFRTQIDDLRQPSISQMPPPQYTQFSQPNLQSKPIYSRTDQNFYRGSNPSPLLKNQMYAPQMQNQTNASFGYGMGNAQGYNNYGNNGTPALNYNAYGQKEYDDLKQQFFRPPVAPRMEPYQGDNSYFGSRGDNSANYPPSRSGLAVSSSTELLSAQIPKPSGRVQNPFSRQ